MPRTQVIRSKLVAHCALLWSLFATGCGQGRDPAPLGQPDVFTFDDDSGTKRTVNAISGHVIVRPDVTASAAAIADVIASVGATVLVEHPAMYRLAVEPGTEREVINTLRERPEIRSALPNVIAYFSFEPSSTSLIPAPQAVACDRFAQIDGESVVGRGKAALYVVDRFRTTWHGHGVHHVAVQSLWDGAPLPASGATVCLDDPLHSGETDDIQVLADAVATAIYDTATAAIEKGERAVINLSGEFRGDATTFNHNEHVGLQTVAEALYHFEQSELDHFVIIKPAGNGVNGKMKIGVDLSRTLEDLRLEQPRLFDFAAGRLAPRVLVVGGSGSRGTCDIDETMNFSKLTSPKFPYMVFAANRDVDMGMGSGNGTSFAAPKVSNALVRLLDEYPDLRIDEVVHGYAAAELINDCNTWTGSYAEIQPISPRPCAAIPSSGIMEVTFRALFPSQLNTVPEDRRGRYGVHAEVTLNGQKGRMRGYGKLATCPATEMSCDTYPNSAGGLGSGLMYAPLAIESCTKDTSTNLVLHGFGPGGVEIPAFLTDSMFQRSRDGRSIQGILGFRQGFPRVLASADFTLAPLHPSPFE